MTGDLKGAVAVVTGASSGIGLAIATELSRRGASLVLAARSRARLEEASNHLPGPSCVVPVDIAVAGAAPALVETAVRTFGTLDIAVANAGVYLSGDLWTSEPAAIERLLSTNINGAIQTVRAALTVMLSKATGDIVVTSSVSGYQAVHWEPVYTASKHALRAFVHSTRRQLAGKGVRLGEVAPGVVHTDLWSVAGGAGPDDLAGRTAGVTPEDVAEAVAFMLTRPRHVTVRDLVLLPSDQQI